MRQHPPETEMEMESTYGSHRRRRRLVVNNWRCSGSNCNSNSDMANIAFLSSSVREQAGSQPVSQPCAK